MSGAILLPLDVRKLIWEFMGIRPYYNKYTGKVHMRIIAIAKRYATLNKHYDDCTDSLYSPIQFPNVLSLTLSRWHNSFNIRYYENLFLYKNNKHITYFMYINYNKRISTEHFTTNTTKPTRTWYKRLWNFIKCVAKN